ncbi:hypothetical protein TWF730_009774 [Orbilia blumenaviensis]|uniref:Uncharacterized protein n=1 Tax=Orbilia blumenaviensis TaxID=1796055 RepID=A0AAV9UTL8_9PEZI
MRELILMQAIINAYNAPPKFDIAAQALGITVKAVSGRYSRLKKKVEEARVLHPLYDVGEDGKPIKRGRGRPPKRPRVPVVNKMMPTVLAPNDDEDGDSEETLATRVIEPTAGASKAGKGGVKTIKVEYPSSDDECSSGI